MSTYGPTIFELAKQRHDPETCERKPCAWCGPRPVSKAPPLDPDKHEHRGPTPDPMAVVHGIGLASHPPVNVLASDLRELADLLEREGDDAKGMASTLAARGWGSATMGDGRRGAAALTKPEAEASKSWPKKQGGTRWFGADVVYAQLLADVGRTVLRAHSYTDDLMAHASDDDRTVTGSGECRACAAFCDPSKKPGNRLVKSMCPTCYRAWRRYELAGGSMIRQDWISQRREGYTERDPAGNVVKVHTPEPDHDLDLSSERIGDVIDLATADTRETGSEQEGP